MVQEPHYPSHKSAIAVFFVIFLMIICIFAWAFWLNRGDYVFESSLPFSVLVNDELFDCPDRICSLHLSPNVYSYSALSEGYRPLDGSFEILRWKKGKQSLSFELIPYLKAVNEEGLPGEPPSEILMIQKSNGEFDMIETESQELITTFESLIDPVIQVSPESVIVFDRGRLFSVQRETGRKQRLFDDTVSVRSALMSRNGKRVLISVDQNDQEMIWLWFPNRQEIVFQEFSFNPEHVQWKLDSDYQVYIISDELTEENESLLKDVLDTINTSESAFALFELNLDTGKVDRLDDLTGGVPVRFMRRGDRYFLQYEDESWSEMVIAQDLTSQIETQALSSQR